MLGEERGMREGSPARRIIQRKRRVYVRKRARERSRRAVDREEGGRAAEEEDANFSGNEERSARGELGMALYSLRHLDDSFLSMEKR